MGELFFVLASQPAESARTAWRVAGVEVRRGAAEVRARSILAARAGRPGVGSSTPRVSQVRVYSRAELVDRVGDARVRRIEDVLAKDIAEKRSGRN